MNKIRKGSIIKKLLSMIILGILLPMLALIIIYGMKFNDFSTIIAKNKAFTLVNSYSRNVEKKLDQVFISVNALADIQSNLFTASGTSGLKLDEIHKVQKKLLEKNEQALVAYTILQPGRIKDPLSDELNKSLVLLGDIFSDGKFSLLEDWNYKFKSNVTDILKQGNGYMLLPPYKDFINGDSILLITYAHSIIFDNEIIGLMGIDISIDWMQDFVSDSSIFDDMAEISIISGKGVINAHNKDESLVGENISTIYANSENEIRFLNSNNQENILEDGFFKFYVPIKFKTIKTPWHVRIAVPKQVVLKESFKSLLQRLILAIGILSFTLFITYFYINKLIKRISAIATSAKRVAKGNLGVKFTDAGNDEIRELSDSLQSMISRFTNIISSIKKTTGQLYDSGNELSNVAIKLSEGASKQASSTEEVSASMEEMTANIEQNAENAKAADSIARKSAEGIEISSKNVIQTTNSMGEIANKTSIIGDIAFQTNILALNAAIEAARAGVHGKGFGVVASEVGKLADHSKKAASEIDELTKKSFGIAQKSGELLEQIAPDINKTAQLVQEITNASLEQKAGTEQINNAIQQLNNVTQENAGSAELLATNVEALNALADKLNKLIGFFKVDNEQKTRPGNKEKAIKDKTVDNNLKKKKEPIVKSTIDVDTLKDFSFQLNNDKKSDDEFEKF